MEQWLTWGWWKNRHGKYNILWLQNNSQSKSQPYKYFRLLVLQLGSCCSCSSWTSCSPMRFSYFLLASQRGKFPHHPWVSSALVQSPCGCNGKTLGNWSIQYFWLVLGNSWRHIIGYHECTNIITLGVFNSIGEVQSPSGRQKTVKLVGNA